MRRGILAGGAIVTVFAWLLAGLVGATAAQGATPAAGCVETTEEENVALVERWFRAWDSGDVDAFDELLADDHSHAWAQGPDTASAADFKQRFLQFSAAFSGFATTIDDVMAQGDMVAVRWTTTGTNDGSLFGMEPTGQTVSWTGVNVYRFECGRIAESWSENDLFSLMQQLGVPGVPGTPTD